jgi:hypothetical protein
MNDQRFDGIPLILETPEHERWAEEIALLYSLVRPRRRKQPAPAGPRPLRAAP